MTVTRLDTGETHPLAQNWGAVVLRGATAALFGVFTLFAPGLSLAALVLLYGAYALIDGVLAVIAALRHTQAERWWVLLLQGLAGVAAGVVTFFWPRLTAIALLYLIAAWALVTGAFEIAVAVRLRRAIRGEWLLAVSGVTSLVLGVLLMAFPVTGALALVTWIGAYALISGMVLLVLGIRLRGWERTQEHEPVSAHASPASGR